jgi:hypothetical protein
MKEIRVYWDTSDNQNVGWAWDTRWESGELDIFHDKEAPRQEIIKSAKYVMEKYFGEKVTINLDY